MTIDFDGWSDNELFRRLRRLWTRRDPLPPGLVEDVLVALAAGDLGRRRPRPGWQKRSLGERGRLLDPSTTVVGGIRAYPTASGPDRDPGREPWRSRP